MIEFTKSKKYVYWLTILSGVLAWIFIELIPELRFMHEWYSNNRIWFYSYFLYGSGFGSGYFITLVLITLTTFGYFLFGYGVAEKTNRLGIVMSFLSIVSVYILVQSLPVALYLLSPSMIVCGFDWVRDRDNLDLTQKNE